MRLRDRFNRNKRTPSTRTQRTGFAFFWLILVAYAYFISSAPNFNTESHLFVAASIVDHHAISIDAYHRRLGDESYVNGHFYSDKAPGLSFLAAPVYGLLRAVLPTHRIEQYEAAGKTYYAIPRDTAYIRYAITYLLVSLPSALLAVLLWRFLSGFVSSGWALGVAGVYATGTIAYPYSAWFFSHQIAAILLFCSFLLVFLRVRHRQNDRRVFASIALAGFLAGFSVISEFPTVLAAAMLGAYLVSVTGRRVRAAAVFIAGMVPAAILNVMYNLAAFGKPLATGYMYVSSTMYRNHIAGGALGAANPLSYGVKAPSFDSLWEITFGTYRGIFLLCPVLLLFFAGLIPMWKRRDLRPEWTLCTALVLLYFLMVAGRGMDVNGWSGGSSVASRHLAPVLPFMMVPIVFGLRIVAFRYAFVLFSVLSVGAMLLTMASGNGGGYSITDHNPLVHTAMHDFLSGKVEVNWGFMIGLTGYFSLVPLVIVSALLLARLVWLTKATGNPQVITQPAEMREAS